MKALYNSGATDLKNIFLAPLEAVITADIELAQKISNFIALHGFEGNGLRDITQSGNIGKLRMINFSFINSKGKSETVSIPILSLIQLPLLCIKDADFDMRVKMVTTDDKEPGPVNPPFLTGALSGTTTLARPKRSSVRAFLSPEAGGDKLSESMKANMKVRLRMGQSDMPGGIVRLLAMLNDITQLDKTHENV